MKLEIIIPNYNGADLIGRNIRDVIDSVKDFDWGLIIVDDGSTSEDKNKIRSIVSGLNDKKISLIEHDKNKGFSSAVNTGVKNSDATYVVLLNSDVKPKEGFLASPLKSLESNSKIFGVGFMDESIEKGSKVLRGRGVGYWNKGMMLHRRGEVDRSQTFWISGGSCIIRREYYEKLGGMDELFNPFYWEDIDLSYRAQKAGYTVLFDKNAVVEHHHEVGAIKSHFDIDAVNKIAFRNQFIFIWKNITDSSLLLSHFINLPLNILSSVKSGNFTLLQGFFLAVSKLPVIIKKRRIQEKLAALPDRLIIENSK